MPTKKEVDYKAQYEPKILNLIQIPYNSVTRGHIVEFKYQKDVDPHLVMILTPKWENKMHGIKLNVLPYIKFNEILKRIHTSDAQLIREAISEMRVPTKSTIQQPTVFYRTYFKPASVFNQYNPYRTYIIKDIRDVVLVDFDYGDYYNVDNPPIKGSNLKRYRGAPKQ